MRVLSFFSSTLKPAASSSRPRITVTVLPPLPPRVGCTRTICCALAVGSAAGPLGRCRLSALLNSCQPPFGIHLSQPACIVDERQCGAPWRDRLLTLSRRSAVDP